MLLRQAQWALDDAAHDLPAGRATPQARESLAGALESLAGILRASVPMLTTSVPLALPGDQPDP